MPPHVAVKTSKNGAIPHSSDCPDSDLPGTVKLSFMPPENEPGSPSTGGIGNLPVKPASSPHVRPPPREILGDTVGHELPVSAKDLQAKTRVDETLEKYEGVGKMAWETAGMRGIPNMPAGNAMVDMNNAGNAPGTPVSSGTPGNAAAVVSSSAYEPNPEVAVGNIPGSGWPQNAVTAGNQTEWAKEKYKNWAKPAETPNASRANPSVPSYYPVAPGVGNPGDVVTGSQGGGLSVTGPSILPPNGSVAATSLASTGVTQNHPRPFQTPQNPYDTA